MGRRTFGLRGHLVAATLLGGLVGCSSLTPPGGAGDAGAPPPPAEALPPASPAAPAPAATPAATTAAPAATPSAPKRPPVAARSSDADAKALTRWSLGEQDKTLKTALQRWSQTAGWRLVWELGVDYRIEASASIDGTFESAITEVVKNMEHADVPPRAIFYRGNQVLRVVPRGME